MNEEVNELLRSTSPRDVNRGVELLLRLVEGPARSIVMRNGGYRRDADDCIQEAIASLYEKLREDRSKPIDDLRSYILASVKYIWLDKKRREKRLPQDDLGDRQIEDVKTDGVEDEQIRVIASMLEEIPEACRTILTLFYFEKMSMEGIAEVLGYSGKDTVKTKKYKCLGYLREKVKEKWRQING